MKIVFERGTFGDRPYYEMLSYDPTMQQFQMDNLALKMKLVPDCFWYFASREAIYEKIRELWNMNIKSEEIEIEV